MVPPCSDRVSRAPPYSLSSHKPFRVPGYHRLWRAFPDPSTRTCATFGLLPVRSSLLGESRLISFPSGTEIFQFPEFASTRLCIQRGILHKEGVSPFGHSRIDACCQLPGTFRRLPRPSSPLTAKASTVCAWSLDHITPSRLRITSQTTLFTSPTCLNDTFDSFEPKRLLRPKFSKNTKQASTPVPFQNRSCARAVSLRDGGASRDRTDDPLLAKQVLSQLSYGPIVVGLGGLEPPASPLSGVRSNHLSYRPNLSVLASIPEANSGRSRLFVKSPTRDGRS